MITSCASSNLIKGSNSESTKIAPGSSFNAINYDLKNPSETYVQNFKKETFNIGDTVKVTMNGFEEFSGIYTIDAQGNILLGHIGSVQTAGLTIPELQSRLHQNYRTCCLKNPNASIEREGKTFGKIIVDGAVKEAGVFKIDEVIKLTEAVALGGGINEDADPNTVMIGRVIDGERKVSLVNLKNIQLTGAADPLIYPNDVIFIQDSKGRLLYNDFVKTIPLITAVIFGVTR